MATSRSRASATSRDKNSGHKDGSTTGDRNQNKERLIAELQKVSREAAKQGLSVGNIQTLMSSHQHRSTNASTCSTGPDSPLLNNNKLKRKMVKYSAIIALLIAFIAAYWATSDPKCIVGNNLLLLEVSRPAVNCDMCKNIEKMPTVNGDAMTKELFLSEYAYNGVPLLVKGGARNWTALTTFSYKYFKDLFEGTEGALEAVQNDCQFFPYKTNFLTMNDVFNMSEERSRLEPGEKEWYVGW